MVRGTTLRFIDLSGLAHGVQESFINMTDFHKRDLHLHGKPHLPRRIQITLNASLLTFRDLDSLL